MRPDEQADATLSRAFISYSWSSPTHQSWVINLATRLREDGVDVVLDKWELLPGHDSIKFMEQMVTDPKVTKVIMVCDRIYAEKADGRAGGVGTESQIISPEIYGNASQNKFAAVITELDLEGKAYIPTFYKGRIYFDFSSSERDEAAYEELLRWLVDMPLHIKPKLGSIPAFISSGQAATTFTASRAKRVEEAVRQGSPNIIGLLSEYSDALIEEFSGFSIERVNSEDFDEKVVDEVERFRPYARQYQDVVMSIARYGTDHRLIDGIARFLEKAATFMYPPSDVNSWHTHQYDQYKIIAHDLFLSTVAILLKEERFDLASTLTRKAYLIRGNRERNPDQRTTTSFTAFGDPSQSLEHRNRRLNLNRLVLQADFISEWYKGRSISFDDIMQADFILYLISIMVTNGENQWDRWYPMTLVYAARKFSPFEIFARAESKLYFEEIKNLLGSESVEAFKIKISAVSEGQNRLRFSHHYVPVGRLANVVQLGSVA